MFGFQAEMKKYSCRLNDSLDLNQILPLTRLRNFDIYGANIRDIKRRGPLIIHTRETQAQLLL
jgi:hypothetical protein